MKPQRKPKPQPQRGPTKGAAGLFAAVDQLGRLANAVTMIADHARTLTPEQREAAAVVLGPTLVLIRDLAQVGLDAYGYDEVEA
ncbi:MAG: hypothetical protein R3B72_01375 [Polyangiaceae bacterium]